jgi:methylated-DNA-[protein]-cysteine S-methyltransferase
VRTDLTAYFRGTGRSFRTPPDLALATAGFPRRVLAVTATIPHGELWTYGDVAAIAGAPRAARAAGNALARCPIELFVPCHRVVQAGSGLGGYGRSTERKRWLIAHERDARAAVGEDGGA